ncbi:MAG: SDR family oxidoreductase [Pseudomonadota bacterium]
MTDNARTVLVTGASSGIGAALVRRLTAQGHAVTGLARRADRLEALAEETGCAVEALDMRDFAAVGALVRRLEPEVVINNAGSGQGFDGLVNASPEEIAASIELNVMGPLHVVRAAIPAMKAKRRGHIVNMGSIAGLYPIVSALYGASKGAVHLMSQNLRVELKGTGIRMTEIAPGRVTSEFYDAGGLPPEKASAFKQSGITELTPDDIASAVLFALDAPPHVNVGLIELTPTEQALGGAHLTPTEAPS